MAILHCGGMDRTLKSTICDKLSKILQCNVYHFDKPKDLEDGKQQYFNFLNETYKTNDIICDRYHDGEHVYAPLYRGYESNYLKEFELQLRKYPYLFINTTADIDVILERIKLAGEDFVKEEHYQTVLDLFERYVEKQSMPYIKIDTSAAEVDKYIERILNATDKVKRMYEYAVKNGCQNIYYGNMEADNFIIVDKDKLELVKQMLIKNKTYNNFWITTNEDSDFVDYQMRLLQPEEIIIYGGNK